MSNPLVDELYEMGAIPSVEIALPTMAAFYPKDKVLKKDADPANISIGPLSMLEESAILDPMLLISGRAITRLINHIAVQVDNPQELCEVDVQAMLIACRMASYGNELVLEHVCPHCENTNTIQIDLSEHIQRFSPYTTEELNEFNIETSIGQIVSLKPISYEDAVNLTISSIKTNIDAEEFENISDKEMLSTKYIEAYKKQFEKVLSTNVDAMTSTIYYVTTKSGKKVTDRSKIQEWIATLPPVDINLITERVKKINEDIQERSKLELTCQSCKKNDIIYVELDPQKLFTQAGDSKPKQNFSAKQKTTEKTTKKSSKTSGRLS